MSIGKMTIQTQIFRPVPKRIHDQIRIKSLSFTAEMKAPRNMLARFLEKLGLKPVILHEQPNEGRTIIEKFEDHAKVGFAVVLLTPDDVGSFQDDKYQPPSARTTERDFRVRILHREARSETSLCLGKG